MNRESFYLKTPLGRLRIDLWDRQLYSVSKVTAPDHRKGFESADFFSSRQNLKGQNRGKGRGQESCAGKPQRQGHGKKSPAFELSLQTEDQGVALSVTAQRVKNQIEGYFLKKNSLPSVPLFNRGTPFQKTVWRELRKISYGTTVTYRELAQRIGNPRAARAVGQACAKNPFLIVAPCHRVVAENHLGGFALGLSAKRLLLKGERAIFSRS